MLKPGQILFAGSNFGTGSSREQAATALKHAGIQAVVCASVNETYKRNALNNGLIVLEIPAAVAALRARATGDQKGKATVVFAEEAELDFARSQLRIGGETYAFGALGTAAQELIAAGGLENWVKARLEQ